MPKDKDPAFLFYPSDFIVGTIDMTFEEMGKYMKILCVIHQKGHLKEETIRLLVGSISETLKDKFKIDKDGLWYNERLEKEISKRGKFVDSRRNNGKLGGRPKKKKEPMKNLQVNLPINENESINETLLIKNVNEFLKIYGKGMSHLSECVPYWDELSTEEIEAINYHLPKYIDSKPVLQYRLNPANYLHKRKWEDPIEDETGMPNRYDAKYERTLQGDHLVKYHQHLVRLGWKKNSSPGGGTTWIKPKNKN